MDNSTISRLAKLHPKLRDEVSQIITNIHNRGIEIRIVQGLRTFAEQNTIYAQGRTLPGKIVSNAKGGQSYHNYGLSLDFCLLHKDGSISWNMKEDIDKDNTSDWMEVVEEFEKFGWSWGGHWKFQDTPHFEKTFGYNFKQLMTKIDKGEVDNQGYVLI